MNSLKGIRDDIEKSTLISKKVLGKIVELIGETTYQLLEDEYSDIITTTGEVAICLDSLENLEKENEQLKQVIAKVKTCPMLICHNCQQDCIVNTEYNKDWFKNWEIIK